MDISGFADFQGVNCTVIGIRRRCFCQKQVCAFVFLADLSTPKGVSTICLIRLLDGRRVQRPAPVIDENSVVPKTSKREEI